MMDGTTTFELGVNASTAPGGTSGPGSRVVPRSSFLQLFDTEHQPVAVIGEDLLLVDANDRFVRDVGLSRPEVLGRSIGELWDFTGEDIQLGIDAQLDELGVATINAGPTPAHRDVPPATLWFTRIRGDSGERVGYALTFIEDATRHNKRQLTLDAEGFQLSFDQIAVGMLLGGLDGYAIRCNPAMVRLFDRSIDEIANTELMAMIHPADRARAVDQALRLLTGELDSYGQDTRLLAGDGRTVWVHETASCVRDHDGNVLHFITQFIDITDRKRAEDERNRATAELLESQSTVRFLFDGVPMPLLQLDSKLTISAANESLADLLGREPIGVSIAEIMHPDDLALLAAEGAGVTSDSDWLIDIRVRCFDGTERLVRSHGRIQRDELGQFRSATASWHDITEAKRHEERLQVQASTDSLTGLPNRAAFLDRLAKTLAAGPERVAVLFIDLDRFKAINDHSGHEAGDHVLGQVARRLRTCVRATDMVARLGGDEFIIMIDLSVPGAAPASIGQRIVEHLAHPYTTTHGTFTIGVSVGLAQSTTCTEPAELIHQADLAAYQAKAHGGSRLTIATTQS
jgi:diguanylate cyclase (GGDEF)-like protein/PAS domain S-box-containing protein